MGVTGANEEEREPVKYLKHFPKASTETTWQGCVMGATEFSLCQRNKWRRTSKLFHIIWCQEKKQTILVYETHLPWFSKGYPHKSWFLGSLPMERHRWIYFCIVKLIQALFNWLIAQSYLLLYDSGTASLLSRSSNGVWRFGLVLWAEIVQEEFLGRRERAECI